MSRLPMGCRLAFLWSLNQADDEGRFFCDVPTLVASVFRYYSYPDQDAEIGSYVDRLVRDGRWLGYEVNGERIFCIPHWHSWQAINRPSASRMPPPPIEALEAYEAEFGPVPRSREEAREVFANPKAPGITQGDLLSRPAPAPDDIDKHAREVFAYWRDAIAELHELEGRRTQVRPRKYTPKRKQKALARLREGYTVEQLKGAIDGCLLSPWHRGKNPSGVVYDDLELILRNGEKVDQFLQMKERTGGDGGKAEDEYIGEVIEQTIARRERARKVARAADLEVSRFDRRARRRSGS